ncbi:MAG: thiamine pyrophosphate-dependent enzyme [Desulfovibrionales bacterium]
MVSVEDFGNYETAWCPGCGNFSILRALKKALSGLDIAPHQVLFVSGIGQAAKTPHYLKCNCFNGLHGRGLPPAQAAKLANPGLNVIVESGDGCNYGEGGNHFLAAVRRNVDLTMLVHDNQVYGLTKGQASPTTMEGAKSKSQPFGPPSTPFNPMAVAVAMRASFVARGFSGEIEHLVDLVQQAIQHKGFSLVDIFQPCVSFNKVNTFKWYQEHCYKLEDHDPTNWDAAMEKAMEFGDKIPLGVIYKNDRDVFGSNIPTLPGKPLATHTYDPKDIEDIMRSYA